MVLTLILEVISVIIKPINLIDNGADINIRDNEGENILMMCRDEVLDDSLCEFLIKNKIDLNARNKDGLTALMIFSSSDNREMVQYLIDNGADLEMKDNNGNTALDCAFLVDHFEIADILIKAGAQNEFKPVFTKIFNI